jgi:hypothetical protein
VSDLPDIETGQVSFIAYFNAIDQGGVQSIDPEEVTSDAGIESATLYDNGVDGTYDLTHVSSGFTNDNGPVECQFRVKSDGWMVAYLDQSEEFNQNVLGNAGESGTYPPYPVDSGVTGWWRLDPQWAGVGENYQGGTPPDGVNHGLARTINSLRGEFSNSGSISYSASDVGLYNFQYSDATAHTLLTSIVENYQGGAGGPWGFSYTGSTTIEAAAMAGGIIADLYDGDLEMSFENTKLVKASDITNDHPTKGFGVINPVSRGLIPNADTTYEHHMTIKDGGDYRTEIPTAYLLWS